MMACRTASIVAFGALFVAGAIGACREAAPPSAPPLTTAHPTTRVPLNPPPPGSGSAAMVPDPTRGVVSVAIASGAATIDAQPCARVLVAVAKGTTKAGTDVLATGDVLVVDHPDAIDLAIDGFAVTVVQELVGCASRSRPATVKKIRRAKDARELTWANGTMRAHLDVDKTISPELYLGRLEGTARVAEHEHASSNEILVAIEATGTLTLDGKESRLLPRQIVTVPKGVKHSWTPDPGSKLVAIQLYDPPGPEQRFIALSAAAWDEAPPTLPEKR